MKARFRSNSILEVRRGSDVFKSVVEVKDEIKNHFAARFSSTSPYRPQFQMLINRREWEFRGGIFRGGN